MLIVIGIIAVLSIVAMTTYRGVINQAQKTRAEEIVHETYTALMQVMQVDDAWPQEIYKEGSSGNGELTPEVAYVLANRGVRSAKIKSNSNLTGGLDKFGIVDPWADDVIKAKFKANVSLETKVSSGGTIRDHRLRFAIDDDYNGIVEVKEKGMSARVRGSCAVWGAGKDGIFGTADDLRSWSKGQEIRSR